MGTIEVVDGLIGVLPLTGRTIVVTRAEAQAAEVLANAASAGVVFNFASAAGAALAAAAAWFSATTGGSHRDEGIAIHGVVPPYLRERFKRS